MLRTRIFHVVNCYRGNYHLYDIFLKATTRNDMDRWHTRITIRHFSMQTGLILDTLCLDVIDFLMLRRFLIEAKVTGDYPQLCTTKSKKFGVEYIASTIDNLASKLKISESENDFHMYEGFISFIVKGSFMKDLRQMSLNLNIEMEPLDQKYWYHKGHVIIDEGEK